MDNATVQEPQHDTEQQPVEKKPRLQGIKGFVNSPWLFLVVPVLAGAVWLAMNTWVITNNLDKPYMLALGPVLVLSLVAIKLVLNFFSVIEKWIKLQFERAKQAKRGQFLEFVIAVFMFVSVCEAGPFFNEVQGNILGGALGYVTVFAFDLVAVVCMRGRAKMLRKGHDKQAFVYQLGVWLCAVVSIFANFYSSINNVQQAIAHNAGLSGWMGAVAPLVGVVFPVMIVFLSYATDSDDEIDDPDTFKAEQEKKVKFAQAKYEIAHSLLAEKVKMDLLKQREFFVKSWFFTKKKINFVIETVKTEVLGEFEKVKQELGKNLEVIKGELFSELKRDFQPQIQSMRNDLNQAHQRLSQQSQIIEMQASQIDEMRGMIHLLKVSLQDVKDECIGSVYDAVKSELSMQITPALIAPNRQVNTQVIEAPKSEKTSPIESSNAQDNQEMDEDTYSVLSNYPIVAQWHATGVRSVSIVDIKSGTGHTPQMVHKHEKAGAFKRTKREGYYRVDSVIAWLKTVPLPKPKATTKEEDNQPDNNEVIIPETPALMEVNNDPDTGEYEAIMKGQLEELSA